ncbi:putative secreted protein with PEP-CTERM sorting signal [Aquabacterium commune]|uniref:Putative secreted protein with PEP-CTERM sorting signal n=1 Tax=Aquabacterium commune TaxID=70586 RepID=A0A4R6RJK7_9BURK|nr:PEP-CTERM sorting domain-containing protein [Aquabacterium commune]TDP85816.1 putative secreted protein with PEP-CTERM sorting signal [Aquabacterium commune]
MKLSSALSLLALAVVPAVSSATSAFVIDFNNLGDIYTSVDNAYAAQGVSFTNVLTLVNGDGLGALAGGNYYTPAANLGSGVAFVQLDGTVNTASYMNVASAVDYKLSFDYTAISDVTISAYSGLNGTGTFLGSYTLAGNGSTLEADVWTNTTFNFNGQAQSFALTGLSEFAAPGAFVAIDNITAVPEPTSLALLAAALGVVGFAARRRQA